MTALLLAVLALAALAAAYLAGVHVEHRRTAADFTALKGELDSTYAAMVSIPDWTTDAVIHRQEVGIEHRLAQAEPRARLDFYFGQGRAA
ncbi:hypothetical protein ACN27B_08500 [Micromonospora sp. WMMD754]|uniref:hypothetical protein n=1 Tax=Micromonospora sp. WMMD754 TaxID=3404114 RepID=UPI003BF47ECF